MVLVAARANVALVAFDEIRSRVRQSAHMETDMMLLTDAFWRCRRDCGLENVSMRDERTREGEVESSESKSCRQGLECVHNRLAALPLSE